MVFRVVEGCIVLLDEGSSGYPVRFRLYGIREESDAVWSSVYFRVKKR